MEVNKQNAVFTKEAILISGYFLIQFLANLTVGKSISFLMFQIPVGSLLFVITFTWIDMVNDYLGKRRAQILVLISVAFYIITYFWFQFFLLVPDERMAADSFEQRAFEFVMGGYWRIFIASVVTAYISENIDILIFNYIKHNTNYPRWVRSWVSNIFSSVLDGVLFAVLAFAGTIPLQSLWTISYSSSLYKLIIATISVPLIYTIKERTREKGELVKYE